ncbi:outer membrane protein [Amaricoccus solimangrovi]|uniref:Outer membrane protein beta-barrel domain-containing protein n=1 Tax=Amaricoccus solimangrovi TaxID=2589815 RepID=A0A501WB52_9RHOB|nr:hypothetical protein [Amaricoccus solimangrovi]TPE46849.1 hypothetical protein FJM51_21240 [Amaricoccus solimangrovi]
MRAWLAGCVAGAAVLASVGGASAEALPDWASGWSGRATLYGWLPVINGAQEGPDGEPLVDLDTNDVLSRLDTVLMTDFELRKDRWGLLLDAVYVDLSNDANWVQDRIRTSTNTRIGMYTLAATYRAYENTSSFADVYAGGRYFDTGLDFGIATDRRGREVSADLSWSDPIVGLRGGMSFGENWSLRGFADVGGFDGSDDLSWQVYGGGAYAFNRHWEAAFGYRYLSILYQASDRVKLDLTVQGPLVGISYLF